MISIKSLVQPATDYKLVVTHPDYEAAQAWLPEDEDDRVPVQLLAEEIL